MLSPNVPTRKRAIGSYHDIALQQAKSLLSENDTAVHARTMKSIGVLLNFLTSHGDSMQVQGSTVRKFEQITLEQLAKLGDDSVVHRLLRTAGWMGARYQYSPECPVDVATLKQMLATLYLSRSAGSHGVTEVDHDDVVKSFSPNTLVRCVQLEKTMADVASANNRKRSHAGPAVKELSALEAERGISSRGISFFGTCMLVDISGFTKLSAALCTKGSAGLDDLHLAISGYLGRCVEIVYAHGGDVISFAGDALICTFSLSESWDKQVTYQSVSDLQGPGGVMDDKREPGKHSPNALAAVRCAMELKEHCTDTLTAHIAVSCGEMSFAMLGGHNKEYIYMVVGGCINEIATCIDDAKSKQVVVTPLVAEWIAKEAALRDESDGIIVTKVVLQPSLNVRIESIVGNIPRPKAVDRLSSIQGSASMMRKLSKFTPPPVLHSLSTNSFQVSSQLREVTTMFLKLDSFDASAMAESVPLLQRFFLMAQKILADTGGFMRQFLVDDKGCVLIAMWGVPSFSHANNCSRSLLAAGRIYEGASGMDQRCSVGITTGDVYCGTVGSVTRRDYVGIGTTVNLSARFMGKAKGRILIDAETFHRLPLESRELLQEIEPLHLKGIEKAVAAYSCPTAIDEVAAVENNMDEGTEEENGVRLQRNIAVAVRIQLNSLMMCVKERGAAASLTVGESLSSATPLGMNSGSVDIIQSTSCDGGGLDAQGAASIDDSKGVASSTLLSGAENSPLASRLRVNSFFASMRGTSSNDLKEKYTITNTAFETDLSAEMKNIGSIRYDLSPAVTFTLIQGPSGSGKTTCVEYFRRSAAARGLRSICIRAQRGDENVAYRVMGRLLVDLIGPDELNSERRQKATLKHLVRLAFPESDPMMLLRGSRTLSAALGYKWLPDIDLEPKSVRKRTIVGGESDSHQKEQNSIDNVDIDGRSIVAKFFSWANVEPITPVFHKPGGRNGSLDRPRGDSNEDSESLNAPRGEDSMDANSASFAPEKVDIGARDEMLTKILVLLLQTTPTALVIDDAHHADELSWTMIRSLLDLPLQLAVVLSLLSRPVKEAINSLEVCEVNRNSVAQQYGEAAQNVTGSQEVNSAVRSSGDFTATQSAPLVGKNIRYTVNESIRAIQGSIHCNCFDMEPLQFVDVFAIVSKALRKESKRKQARLTKRREVVPQSISADASTFSSNSASLDQQQVKGSSMVIKMDASKAFAQNATGAVEETSNLTPIEQIATSDLIESILRVSNGNPFWCNAIADFIVERGVEDFKRNIEQANEVDEEALAEDAYSPQTYGNAHNGISQSLVSDKASVPNSRRTSSVASPLGSFGANHLKQRNPLDILVVCRLEKLPYNLQVILKHAAVVGHVFSISALRAVLPPDQVLKLEESIEKLLESSFILCAEQMGEDSQCYSFQNYLMRNAIYNLIPPSGAAKVHELVAEHIESTHSDNLVPVLGSLCHHYGRCPERAHDALRYASLAFEQCVSRHAVLDALYFLRRATIFLSSSVTTFSSSEIRPIVSVIDVAIGMMKPDGVLTNIMKRLKGVKNPPSIGAAGDKILSKLSNCKIEGSVNLPIYVAIRSQLTKTLQETVKREAESGARTNVGADLDPDKTYDRYGSKKASYTHGWCCYNGSAAVTPMETK